MLGKILYSVASLVLFLLSAFFVVIVGYLVRSEVMPAIRQGSMNVETRTMILNVLWEGNEIYILLTGYLLLAAGLAYGAVRLITSCYSRKQSSPAVHSGTGTGTPKVL